MKVYAFLGSLFLFFQAGGQKIPSDVQVGGSVPQVVISNFLKSKDTKNLASFYQNKLLIIDFWATWCPPCIRALVKADGLRKKYRGSVEFLAVTYQDQQEITEFLKERPALQRLSLPVVTADSVLYNLFPYRILPHCVWINASGKVIAITSSEQVTEKNIELALKNGSINLPLKKDLLDFDMTKTFHVEDSMIQYRSILTYTPQGITNGGMPWPLNYYWSRDHKYSRLFYFGKSILELYLAAVYCANVNYKNSYRYILDVKDSSKFMTPRSGMYQRWGYSSYSEWRGTNSYAYELILPRPIKDTLAFRYMLEDLNRSLPAKGMIKKVRMPCWVLVNVTDSSKKLKSRGGEPKMVWEKAAIIKSIQNTPLDDLLRWLNRGSNTYWIQNETVNEQPLDLELDIFVAAPAFDIKPIRTAFQKHGFDLILAEREIDILYLTDK